MTVVNKTGLLLVVLSSLVLLGLGTLRQPETPPVSVQEAPEEIGVANLFTWVKSTPPQWGTGALYAALGFVGALVTVFGLVGGAVPWTAGFARIEAGLKRIEKREKRLDKLIRAPDANAKVIKAIEKATNNLRDDLHSDLRRQFSIAASLYVILGAFFATLLARDLLQALLIGAGWTAYLGALGLKRDYAERKSIKDKTTEQLEAALPPLKQDGESDDPFEELRMDASISRAL